MHWTGLGLRPRVLLAQGVRGRARGGVAVVGRRGRLRAGGRRRLLRSRCLSSRGMTMGSRPGAACGHGAVGTATLASTNGRWRSMPIESGVCGCGHFGRGGRGTGSPLAIAVGVRTGNPPPPLSLPRRRARAHALAAQRRAPPARALSRVTRARHAERAPVPAVRGAPRRAPPAPDIISGLPRKTNGWDASSCSANS